MNIIMSSAKIDQLAQYITDKVAGESKESKGMKLAISRLLDILLLSAGMLASTYFMSASLSIISLAVTGASSYFIYSMIRKIYIDIRVDTDVDYAQASFEFRQIIRLFTGSVYYYASAGIMNLQDLAAVKVRSEDD